jgi:ATP-dependent DNA helicase DinG
MAKEVMEAFKNKDIRLIEAGTGTGKTMAYLLPALISGKKTVVSTGLKSLQDQIFYKDLQFIQRYFDFSFQAVLVKGRENYLCLRKYNSFVKRGDLLFASGQKPVLERLNQWFQSTIEGDISELDPEVLKRYPKTNLTTNSTACHGNNCLYKKECFWHKKRRQTQKADLILVNHHIFLADLSFRIGSDDSKSVLPSWDAAIIDEAHLLEDSATQWFGYKLEDYELASLSKALVDYSEGDPKLVELHENALILANLQALLYEFFEKTDGFQELFIHENNPADEALKKILASLAEGTIAISNNLPQKLEEMSPDANLIETLSHRLSFIYQASEFIAKSNDPSFVYQAEKNYKPDKLVLSALPIKVGKIIGQALEKTERPVILTSATLSAGGNFNFLKDRLCLNPLTKSLALPSPFDFKNNTLLYIPKTMPNVKRSEFNEAMIDHTKRILLASKGRALVLFTSFKRLFLTAKALKNNMPWPVLIQTEQPNTKLLEQFSSEVNSVLLATKSFWSGVNVPGESLSVVIIDCLPFSSPIQPLQQARRRLIELEGGNNFNDYSLPEMTLSLRQGLGRLIRSSNDQGLMAVLDIRLITTGYGQQTLKSLPPSPITENFDDVVKFLSTIYRVSRSN